MQQRHARGFVYARLLASMMRFSIWSLMPGRAPPMRLASSNTRPVGKLNAVERHWSPSSKRHAALSSALTREYRRARSTTPDVATI